MRDSHHARERRAASRAGWPSATISPARMLPRKANRTATTRSAPSSRFVSTVRITRRTRVARSWSGTMRTPSGRDGCELLHRLARAGRHLERVLAGQHLDEADHGLAPAVDRGDADPEHPPHADLRYAPDRHRACRPSPASRTIFSRSARDSTSPWPRHVLLPVVLDVPAAGVRVGLSTASKTSLSATL